MSDVKTRLAFARKHWTTKEGKKFSTAGRDWVVDEFWRPACGFKLWPVDAKQLCVSCSASAGSVQDYEHDRATCPEPGCAGLTQEPIIVTVLNLPRRSGKTFNALAFSAASILTSKNESITYVASAKDQTDQLFDENMRAAIEANPTLNNLCHIADNKVTVAKTKSRFECVTTSHKSITGRGRTLVIIDEARDVPAQVAAALLPSIFDHSGWECPSGHVHHEGKPKSLVCSVCTSKLQPWYARIIIESSSGILSGGEGDWFADLVQQSLETPHKNVHLFTTTETINPRISKRVQAAVGEVFGGIEAMRHYIDVEINNVPRRKGEDFLSRHDVERILDPQLENSAGNPDPCVAFLDTSQTVEKTSLVILSAEKGNWERVYTSRIDVWEPAKLPNGIISEAAILDHLDKVMPMFPGLINFGVDTRAMPWAINMVKTIRLSKGRAWGRKVDAFNGGPAERNTAWALFEQRVLSQTIRCLPMKEIVTELAGVQRVKKANGQIEVRDRSRRRSHADIVESIAECCRRAYLEQTRPKSSLASTLSQARLPANSTIPRLKGFSAQSSQYKVSSSSL